jgi:hypothetical protein
VRGLGCLQWPVVSASSISSVPLGRGGDGALVPVTRDEGAVALFLAWRERLEGKRVWRRLRSVPMKEKMPRSFGWASWWATRPSGPAAC